MRKILLFLMLFVAINSTTFAMPEEVDFSYNKLKVGMSYDEMVKIMGESKIKLMTFHDEYAVDEYVYKDIRIDLDVNSKKVVLISIKDKKYENNKGVKIGATLYKLNKEYGVAQKEIIGGKKYYIYSNNQNKEEKLIFDVTYGYVEKIIITDLPTGVLG